MALLQDSEANSISADMVACSTAMRACKLPGQQGPWEAALGYFAQAVQRGQRPDVIAINTAASVLAGGAVQQQTRDSLHLDAGSRWRRVLLLLATCAWVGQELDGNCRDDTDSLAIFV